MSAPAHRQYVAIRFHSRDRRTYTYHNDGAPVAPGDQVRIPGRHPDDGWKAVEVISVTDQAPEFATKSILHDRPTVEDDNTPPWENDLARKPD